MFIRSSGLILIGCTIASCASFETSQQSTKPAHPSMFLFQGSTTIEDRWAHLPLRGKTNYILASDKDGVMIRAEAKHSASGLIRRVNVDVGHCPTLEWQWRVDAVQASADLKVKDKEDVAASLFLLFGDPGFMSSPDPVPTLRYVWTNDQHQKDTVIDNPYLPGIVRSIVVRTGESGRWFTERRDLQSDYQRAFGKPPGEEIHAIALFTDNDQTEEPAIAFYRWAKVNCGSSDGAVKGIQIR